MSFELILPFLRPIERLLLDESISEIMGNPDASWWCERDGKMQHEDAVSFDAAKLLTGLEVIANQLGKKLDEDNPSLHAQLPDGSRLAAWIPPIVRPSPALAIRKFTSRRFTIDDLISSRHHNARACGLPGRADMRAERRCLSAAERGPARRLFCGFWPTSFPIMSGSSSSRTPRNFTSGNQTLLRLDRRRIRSRLRSHSRLF